MSPSAVAVEFDRRPPAELLLCAERPAPLPEDQVALVPAPLRTALIAVGRALRANADRLDRLVGWTDPAACPNEEKN